MSASQRRYAGPFSARGGSSRTRAPSITGPNMERLLYHARGETRAGGAAREFELGSGSDLEGNRVLGPCVVGADPVPYSLSVPNFPEEESMPLRSPKTIVPVALGALLLGCWIAASTAQTAKPDAKVPAK